jgi:2-dehydro-3-deoxyphosphogluconate aldolase/(4S)-4-hydroxy-2-oxoglutarate aldolase
MTGAERAAAWIRQDKVIAILRIADADRAIRTCEYLVEAGLTVLEITADNDHAIASLKILKRRFGDQILLGAGTVLDPATVGAAASAGADFCVAPNLDPQVVAACASRDVLAVPGVLTPTEIVTATRLGLRMLKLFPCAGLSPAFLGALRGPFPSVGFVPTGGIDHASIAGWFTAGAVAVGLGSSLAGGDVTAEVIRTRVRQVRAQVPAD